METNDDQSDLVNDNDQQNANESENSVRGTSEESSKRKEMSSDNGDIGERKNARMTPSTDADSQNDVSQGATSSLTQSVEPVAGTSNPLAIRFPVGFKRVAHRKKRTYRRSRRTTSLFSSEEEDLNAEPPVSRSLSADNVHLAVNEPNANASEPDLMSVMPSNPSSPSSVSSTYSLENARDKVLLMKETTPDFLLKEKPKHKWFITPEIVAREVGFSNKSQGSKLFEERMHGSLHTVQRLELMYKLEQHTGCVNGLNFNKSGSMLSSCSDDLTVCLWDWPVGKLLSSVFSGHKSNVFQTKFLPLQGHIYIATSARDGQVRLLELDTSGSLIASRRVGHHYKPCNKLSLVPDSPHVFLSCGEDAIVLSVDIRETPGSRLLTVVSEGRKVPLYSVSCHPLDPNEFMVGGKNRHIFVYDRRSLKTPVHSLCPSHLTSRKEQQQAYITSSVYNFNGTQILASYNDEDIYLWDRRDSLSDIVHKYQGHRNNATIKGVNFFGPRSEFVVSGSDCGNIYFWERETEVIVQWMAGDENGVVNCLEPHPTIPVLATSGLDEDVKIWVPSCEQDPTFNGLKSAVIMNQRDREEDDEGMERHPEDLDGQVLWLLWRHIRGGTRRNLDVEISERTQRVQNAPHSSSPEMSSDDDDEDVPSSLNGLPNCSTS